MGTMRIAVAAAALALACSAAQALPAVQAEFRLAYYPPNPCIDVGTPTLSGMASLFIDGALLRGGSAGPSTPLACSADGAVADFAIRFNAPAAGTLAFAFAGEWDVPGENDPLVFALAGVPETGSDPPTAAPQLELGKFDADGVFTPAAASRWDLVAHTDDGQLVDVGDIEVQVGAAPEPATLPLLLVGLAGLAGLARPGNRRPGGPG
jgi:hypothetical protein